MQAERVRPPRGTHRNAKDARSRGRARIRAMIARQRPSEDPRPDEILPPPFPSSASARIWERLAQLATILSLFAFQSNSSLEAQTSAENVEHSSPLRTLPRRVLAPGCDEYSLADRARRLRAPLPLRACQCLAASCPLESSCVMMLQGIGRREAEESLEV